MKLFDKVRNALGLREGEYVLSFSLAAYLFLVVASYVVTKNVRDALFLAEFGAVKLPYVSIAIAVLVGIFGSAYLRRSREVRHDVLVISSLFFFAGNLIAFWWLSRFEYEWLYPVIYVWGGVFGVIAPMQVWTLANFVITTRQAKRLYAFVGAGGLLGGIAGGFFTSTLADRFGPEDLLLGVVVALLLCVALVQIIVRQGPRELISTSPGPSAEQAWSLKQSAKLVGGSKYLLVLAGLVMVSGVVTSLVDYQFKAVADKTIHSKEQLATFFGQFYAYAGIGSLLIQLLLTGPLMRRMGLGFTILLAPIGLMLGSVGLVVWGSLVAAIVLRTQDQLLKHSIDRTSVELLYLPLPADTKIEVKSFIDSFLSRVADGTAGVVLVLLTSVMAVSARMTAILNIVLIAAWIALAITARRLYVDELRSAIKYRSIDIKSLHLDAVPDARTAAELTQLLKSNDHTEVLYVLQFAGTIPIGKALIPTLEGLLDHPDPEIRARTLDVLTQTGDDSLSSRVESMLGDESRRVQAKAIEYLRHYGRSVPLDNVFHFLRRGSGASAQSPLGRTAGIAAAALMQSSRTGLYHATSVDTEDDVTQQIAKAEALLQGLNSSDPEQVKAALRQAACTKCPDFVSAIASHLSKGETRLLARRALLHCGKKVLPELEELFWDESVPLRARMAIPRVVHEFGGEVAWSTLARMLDHEDPMLSMSVIRLMNRMGAERNDYRIGESRLRSLIMRQIRAHFRVLGILSVLEQAEDRRPALGVKQAKSGLLLAYLEESLERSLERMFRLVALRHGPSDLRSIYMGLANGNVGVRANSLELFDSLLDGTIRRYLTPLVDPDIGMEEKLRVGEQLHVFRPRDAGEALQFLLQDSDPIIVLCTVDYVYSHEYAELYEVAETVA